MGFPFEPLGQGLVYNVVDYGADPTGTNDSTAAIQAAIDDCYNAGGGVVYCNGSFIVTAQQIPGQGAGIGAALFPRPGVSIWGVPEVTTFLVQPGACTGRADGWAFGFDPEGNTVNVSNMEIRNVITDLTAVTDSFGASYRAANPAMVGSNVAFVNAHARNVKEWGISWGGFTTNFERLTILGHRVNGSVRGGVWIGLTDYAFVHDIYADGVTGDTTTGEGCVLEVESGNYGDFAGIRGESLPIQFLLISGNLEATFRGIEGSGASGAHGIECSASNVTIQGVSLASPGGGSYGLYFPTSSSSIFRFRMSGFSFSGFTNDIYQAAYTAGATIDGVTLSDFDTDSPYPLVTNSTITDFAMSNGTMHGPTRAISATSLSGIIRGVNMNGTAAPSLTTSPNLKITDCPGYNPVGPVTVAVPNSGAATAALPYDATFYITQTTAASSVAVQGQTIDIPVGGPTPVRVPAGQTLTPTYTTAPTWVVQGH